MSNTYFQFKQFTIHQEKAALKVCTDACIFGAWVAQRMPFTGRVLDIGAGTGLLMMMLAQQTDLYVDGIEIDPDSFQQATANIQANPWKERLQVLQGDVKTFSFQHTYDGIITNPPFFENDLISNQQKEQVAKHSTALTLEDLIAAIQNNLTPEGQFAILLPYHRHDYFTKLAFEFGYHLNEQVWVKQHEKKSDYFRTISIYSRSAKKYEPDFLSIRNDQNEYTPAFTALLKDYYLHL